MTHKEAIEYWELFNSEIDDLLPGTYGACKKALEEQREAVEFTIAASAGLMRLHLMANTMRAALGARPNTRSLMTNLHSQ